MLSALLDFLLPRHCLLCGFPSGPRDVCSYCRAALPRTTHACRNCGLPLSLQSDRVCGACLARPPPWDRAVCALPYSYPVDQLVQRFKFNRNLACGRVLAEELLAAVRARHPGDEALPGLIVPVPLHRLRYHWRMFNQSERIASFLGRNLGIPVGRRLLQRVRHTRAQAGLDRRDRRKNLRSAFRCRRPGVAPGHVALVDDVCTTGETLATCTRSIRRAGCREVSVWVAARAPPPGPQPA